MRSALEFFATTQSCRERGGALISSWRPRRQAELMASMSLSRFHGHKVRRSPRQVGTVISSWRPWAYGLAHPGHLQFAHVPTQLDKREKHIDVNDVKVLEGALSRSMTIRAVKYVVIGSPTLKRVTEGRRPKDRSEPQGTTALTTPPLERAGYDCRNNTTSLRRPEAVGCAPSVLAGPLTTSLRGMWVSGLLPPGNGGPC